MKINPVLIILVAALGLALSAGLAVLSIQLDSLPPASLLIVVLVSFGLVILFSLLLRSETRKSERLVRRALENLGFERENWISRQYRGQVDGLEYEILPFFTRDYGDVLALQILLRGAFQHHLTLALPRGLSHFVVWGAETGGQIMPPGYSGFLVYTNQRRAAQALLAQPEMEKLVKELFNIPAQTPIVLEIAPGVIRLRVGHLGRLGFDEGLLRSWLQILAGIGRLVGSSISMGAAPFDADFELPAFQRNSRWWIRVALLFVLISLTALMLIVLAYLK